MAADETLGYRERTITFDAEKGEVEFYCAWRRDRDSLIARNPDPLLAEDLKPGFRVVYKLDQVRSWAQCLRPPVSEAQRAARRERGRQLAHHLHETKEAAA